MKQEKILINRTFCETTPESAEVGDFSNRGFISENEPVTFRELVELMKVHSIPSTSPDDYNTHNWYSTDFYTNDYRTATEREESIHFSKDNAENMRKYWRMARLIANNIL